MSFLEKMKSREDKNKLSLGYCIMLLVGGMIGSAIFSLSGVTMFQAGPSSVITWVMAGGIMLTYGLLMVELSGKYPRSGGVYVFPRMAFEGKRGRFWGWIACWSFILTNCSCIAFAGINIASYLGVAFPVTGNYQILLAILAILICLALNCIDFTLTGKINAIIVIVLVGTMAAYIGTAFFGGSYEPGKLIPFFSQGNNGNLGFLTVVPTAMVGYNSIIAMAFMVSEVKNPKRNIPRSTVVSMIIVVIVYVLMILSTMGLLTSSYLSKNPDMQYIPMFAACFNFISSVPHLSSIVSISAVLAQLTTMLVCVSLNARAIEAASDDRLLPKWLGRNNRYGVPANAAAAVAAVTCIIACFPEMTSEIVNIGVMINCVTILVTIFAYIAAKGRKVIPWIVMAIVILCNLEDMISGGWIMWAYTGGFLILGILMFLISDRRNQEL